MKKTTKLLALVCAMLMLGSVLAGCSSTPAPAASAEATAAPEESAAAEATAAPEESAAAEGTASATPTLDAIRERGQLILGTESTYPPFEFIVIENGQSVGAVVARTGNQSGGEEHLDILGAGFDVMLAQKIAEKLGVTLVTSEMAFDSLIPAIQAGTIDIAASMTPTDERKQAVDFSENYYETSNVFLVRKGEEGNFTSAESFDGKTIGAQVGTAQNDLVVNDMTNAQSLLLPKVTTLVQELKTGNIDAICMEKPAGDIYAAAYPDLVIADYVVADAAGGVAFPAAKGQDDLIAFINETIEELKASGELEKLYQEACAQAIDQLSE